MAVSPENVYLQTAIYRFHANAMPLCEHYLQPGRSTRKIPLVPQAAHYPAAHYTAIHNTPTAWLRFEEQTSQQEALAKNLAGKKLITPICRAATNYPHLVL